MKRSDQLYVLLTAALLCWAGPALSAAPKQPAEEPAAKQEEPKATPLEQVEEKWGIQIRGVLTSANGWMLDFRFKVIDPEKAKPLGLQENKPYLIDQKSGAKFVVPTTPKVGPLRQMSKQPQAGRIYWMLFSNPGNYVKRGSKVSVVIGDFKVEDLTVQ